MTCGLAHMDSAAICGLPAGHERDDVPHGDGYIEWFHHELEIAVGSGGQPIYEVWDEVVPHGR